ncbi:MAG: ABC transporter permease [Anaerolineales bacterium]
MSVLENFRIALRALAANKLRSALTMLGIIIGVAAVVALIAIGNGATADITEQIEGIGSNLIAVTPGASARSGAGVALSWSDYQALKAELGNVRAIAPSLGSTLQLTFGDVTADVSTTGTVPVWTEINTVTVEFGRFFTEGESRSGARVMVLGADIASDVFDNQDPLGRAVRLGNVKFEVIGLLESSGGGFGSRDDAAIIPLEAMYGVMGSRGIVNGERIVSNISISAADSEVASDVLAQTEDILRREHGLKPYEDTDFNIISQEAFLQAFERITGTLAIFLGAIAGISLLVGGIGIMNIMLVSVTERTREIGLRKAVGAKKRTILIQFLIETMTLTMFGGVLGIALGYGIASAVRAADLIPAQPDANSIGMAFFFAVAVGVFFGIYPASRAAALRPIEALRYE